METQYLSETPKEILFNFKTLATSILGYRHTEREKIRNRFTDKKNHPMYNRQHTPDTRSVNLENLILYMVKHTVLLLEIRLVKK